jgi:hypothetical protein
MMIGGAVAAAAAAAGRMEDGMIGAMTIEMTTTTTMMTKHWVYLLASHAAWLSSHQLMRRCR